MTTPRKLTAEELAYVALKNQQEHDKRLEHQVSTWMRDKLLANTITKLRSDNAALRTRLAEAEKDTERLDWLEVQEEKTGRYLWETANPPRKSPYPGGHFLAVDYKLSPFYGDTYREAIDAAMKAEADSALAAPEGKKL